MRNDELSGSQRIETIRQHGFRFEEHQPAGGAVARESRLDVEVIRAPMPDEEELLGDLYEGGRLVAGRGVVDAALTVRVAAASPGHVHLSRPAALSQ